MVQEGGDEAENGGFLAAMLRCGRREGRADLADQLATEPQATRLVPEIAHLRRNRAETRTGADDDGVVFGEFVDRCDRRCLIELEMRGLGDFFRHQFRNALHDDIGARRFCAFGGSVGHRFNMTVRRIIEYKNLRHSLRFLCCNCFRRTGDKLLQKFNDHRR
ncbi:hypothetical protein D3C87_1499470 [compost metagenome]